MDVSISSLGDMISDLHVSLFHFETASALLVFSTGSND